MGAGSSAEQPSPQDGATAAAAAAAEPQASNPEAETPAAAPAEPEQLGEAPAKLLQKNGQISSINGIAEEQAELSLKPEEPNAQQQAEAVETEVGQRETAAVILKEGSAENMEKPPDSTDKTDVNDEPNDSPDGDKQLPASQEKVEQQEQPSELSPSNDVGFKKVFKFVGFKFTVRKDKSEKSEPVQLLNVKADDLEVAADGAGDCKEIKLEVVEETTQSEVSHLVENPEQQTQMEQVKEDTSLEKLSESPVETAEGSKETEVKSDGSKLAESPTSPLANETASPLRKFFTQGWAGFRKKTSFKKSKEDDQPTEREKQGQEKEIIKEENVNNEESEKEKTVSEIDGIEISVEPTDVNVKKETEEGEEEKMIYVSIETRHEEPVSLPSQECERSISKDSEISLTENIGLATMEKTDPVQECLLSPDQSAVALSEIKHAAPLATEVFEEKLDKCESTSPLAMKKTEEHFEILEDKPEPKAPLATESFDEIPTDISTIVKTEEVKTNGKEEPTLEQLVETDAQIQREQSADEPLKVNETVLVAVNEQSKETEPNSGDTATSKHPEGITNEAELLSSQERAKIQGSPLKKLFTSSSLKKLSGKKHKVKREETKSGESVEQTQHLSDSAESPEELKGESSASSPEETIELSSDVVQAIETEEGGASDTEKKRESVTPWASFKKMVTPKKRVRRLSESDKEEELEKAKTATTEGVPYEELEEKKENGEEPKLEKSIDEPKRKVDSSVSWEALICVGSSKKRARKSSSSDEEVGQRLAQEGQKIDEAGVHKETALDVTFTSSQENDQGQGNSSPEQAGSPSEGEGVSTWESFKRLVTPRRKSKTKMEDRTEELVAVPCAEHSASDGDSGKEESWVSLKKLIPGRKKKKSDGIPEHVPVEEVGEEITENNEEDCDVPAVVPLSEYEAAEQEKFETQQAKQDDVTRKKPLDDRTEKSKGALVDEQLNEGLVHAVTVTVVEGERAVTSIEERSPSWISAAITKSPGHANEDDEKQTEQISETGIGEETGVVTKHMPEIRKDISGETIVSELEVSTEAITAREEASGVEEVTEVSCAEETTEMVSAVSRLTESPDTTEVATPVQDVEGQQNLEELSKQTQEVLQEVAERVKLSAGEQLISDKVSKTVIQSISVEESRQETDIICPEVKLVKTPLKVKDPEETCIQTEGTESDRSQSEITGSGLKEALEKRKDTCIEGKEGTKESIYVDGADESHAKTGQERHEEFTEEKTIEEKSEDEDFVFVTVTAEEEPEVKVGETMAQEPISLEVTEKGNKRTMDAVEEIAVNLEETARGEITKGGVPVDEPMKRIGEEKSECSQNLMQTVTVHDLHSENTETSTAEVKKALTQNEVKATELFRQPTSPEELVLEVPIQSQAIFPVQNLVNETKALDITKDVALGLETKSTENIDTVSLSHSVETETPVEKMEPDIHLQNGETEIPEVNVKPISHLLNTETQIHVETMETEISVRKVEVEVHKQNAEIETLIQKTESVSLEEMEKKPCLPSVKAEVIVESKLPTEKTKIEPTEKAAVLTEETEVLAEETNKNRDMEFHAEKNKVEDAQNKMGEEVPTEKAEGKVHVEASAEETGAEMELETPAENAGVKVNVDASVAKVLVEASVEKENVEVQAEELEAEAVKEVEMKVPVENMAMKDLTKDTKVVSPKEMIEIPTEKVEVDIPSEKVEAKALTEKSDVQASAELSEGGEAAAAGLAEKKEAVQNMPSEVPFQSEAADNMNSIISVEAPVCVDLQQPPVVVGDMSRVPVQRGVQDVASSFKVECLDSVGSEGPFKRDAGPAFELRSSEQTVTDKPVERGTMKVSAHTQDAVDSIQNYMADARLALESQHTEEVFPQTNELGDITLVLESKCTEEIATKTPVQKETIKPCMYTEGEASQSTDSSASEGFIQSEKEDALTLKSDYPEAELTEDAVKNELGNTELPIRSKLTDAVITQAAAKMEVGDILDSDNSCTESCQKRQAGSEQVETEKSFENNELAASGEVIYAAPVQQDTFSITTDILELQHKPPVAVTGAATEERIIEGSVAVKETLTETLQSFSEEPKETAFKIVQQVTFAHSGLGDLGPDTTVVPWTGKTESAAGKSVLPDDGLIQTRVLDSIPEMKHQIPELSPETEKQVQSPESGPSLTHTAGVHPVTIESESTKIVLTIIQNAVDKLEKTEETACVPSLMCENKSEIQENMHTDLQIFPVNVENEEVLITDKTIPLTFHVSENGGSRDSRGPSTDLEAMTSVPQSVGQLGTMKTTLVQDPGAVNEAGKETAEEPGLQKENGDTKLNPEADVTDVTVPAETERETVEGFPLGELLKESRDTAQQEVTGVETGQTVQMQEHFIQQQAQAKRKEDQSTGLLEMHSEEDVNSQDYTSCKISQLKSELTEP